MYRYVKRIGAGLTFQQEKDHPAEPASHFRPIRYGLIRWTDLHVETIFTEAILPLISPKLKEQLDLRHPEDLLVS